MTTALAGPFRRQQTARSITSNSSDKQPPPPKAAKPITLAKRLLFPHLPAEADLPPLLVSPTILPELNSELYDFVAIALRAYVNPWWTKITRFDKEFLPAITRVLATVIRTLEARLVQIDLSPLILCELPTLLAQHVADYRNARSKLHSSYAAGGAASLPQLFHQLQPHMALSPDGKVEEAYIRQAVDELLRACLPREDYEPEAERYIVREIVVKVLLDGVIPRVTQPWFINRTVLNLLGPEKDTLHETSANIAANTQDSSPERPPLSRRSSYTFSFQSLAIFFFSAVQSISGACLMLIHAYKHALGTIKKVNQSSSLSTHHAATPKPTPPLNAIPGSLMPSSPIPPPVSVVPPSPPSPPPSPSRPKPSREASTISSIPPATQIPSSSTQPSPSVASGHADCIAPSVRLVTVLLAYVPRSTPIALAHVLNLLLIPFTSLLSRLLPHLLYAHALSAANLVNIVRSAKGALFPGGWPAIAPPDPTPEEQVELRKETVRRLSALIPTPLQYLLGSNATVRTQAMDEILDPFSSQECNAHLIVFILDLVLITLFPEIGVCDEAAGVSQSEASVMNTPPGSYNSMQGFLGDLTPPRPDSRPP